MRKILTWIISLIVIISNFGLTNALAAETGEMSIHPYEWDGENEITQYWYIYNLDKGDSHQDKVVVENTGNKTISVKIYPVDGLTTSDGAFALENEDEEKNDIGAWVTLSKNELTLEPKQSEIVDFTISIPSDTTPGEHIGGIIMENKEIMEGEQINVKTRVGVRIYETVPGEVVKKVNIESITTKSVFSSIWSIFYDHSFTYNLANEGNVQITPTINTNINSPLFGEVNNTSQTLNGSIFPGKTIAFDYKPDSKLYFGPYTLTVTVNLEGQAPMQKSYTLWSIPWKLCAIIVIIVLGLLSFIYLGEHKPSNPPEKPKKVTKKPSKPKTKITTKKANQKTKSTTKKPRLKKK